MPLSHNGYGTKLTRMTMMICVSFLFVHAMLQQGDREPSLRRRAKASKAGAEAWRHPALPVTIVAEASHLSCVRMQCSQNAAGNQCHSDGHYYEQYYYSYDVALPPYYHLPTSSLCYKNVVCSVAA